ncbi:hypothetical protein TPHA_0E03590 [Tetrapisispora phaffii CBS 4417]|uniref:Exocyst complex component Sec10-like alpha-helical bundle domain-containing protein n=1 Tax=Tetrapisispora phaffii (strain ATCC 24235 / CBS 4417 / NBRC 1672 / NRRL Y-8282 / UCD 70-5) TaxID=1071381 RepID=G8BU70_TETPH|nr:hypothetical protein TPHA_0E03590 [Tetrapisispora phaffii CBS 4417]CCE63448.1 hypothetical protein TPHA_0E03590 [Tetrapisispora phaffii CBS 4417]
MEGILKVRNIVVEIASDLNPTDYLNFKAVNKNVYNEILSDEVDQTYWSKRLQLLDLKETQENITDDQFANLTAVDIFDKIVNFNKKQSKHIYIKFYGCFKDYCDKLSNSDLGTLFSAEEENDPVLEAKVLMNIYRFNASNDVEDSYYGKVKEQLDIVKELFVNSVLKELEKNYKLKNYEEVSKFMGVLFLVKESTVAVDFFNSEFDTEYTISLPDNIFKEINTLIIDNQSLSNLIEDESSADHSMKFKRMKVLNKSLVKESLGKIFEYIFNVVDVVYQVFGDNYDNGRFVVEKYIGYFMDLVDIHFEEKENLMELPKFYKLTNEAIDAVFGEEEYFKKLIKDDIDVHLKSKKEYYLETIPSFFNQQLKDLRTNPVKKEDDKVKKSKDDSLRLATLFKKKPNDKDEITEQEMPKVDVKSLVNVEYYENVLKLSEQVLDDIDQFGGDKKKIYDIIVKRISVDGIRHEYKGVVGELGRGEIGLVMFTEVVNIWDMIVHKVVVFEGRSEEGRLEMLLDEIVGEGLNIGISKMMREVENILLGVAYNQQQVIDVEATEAAHKVIDLLKQNCFLLKGEAIAEVFQQEIGERLFNELVKLIKRSTISTQGALYLISDLNLYYDFITYKLKQKNIVPLFAGLKSIGQLFLISTNDSKELGKMIAAGSQGIFSQEEIYEFVQRRSDWFKVKRDVEKAIYGLDCILI